MKCNYTLAVLLCTILLGCGKDEDAIELPPPCLQQIIHPDWMYHHFKSAYTIQLPPASTSYTTYFEGPIFIAFVSDSSIFMQYSFCGGSQCFEWGDILVDAQTDSIRSFGPFLGQPMLDHRLEICDSLVTTGLFYYKLGKSCVGNLYQLHQGNFKESLEVYFDSTDLAEVQTIMQTIRHK